MIFYQNSINFWWIWWSFLCFFVFCFVLCCKMVIWPWKLKCFEIHVEKRFFWNVDFYRFFKKVFFFDFLGFFGLDLICQFFIFGGIIWVGNNRSKCCFLWDVKKCIQMNSKNLKYCFVKFLTDFDPCFEGWLGVYFFFHFFLTK